MPIVTSPFPLSKSTDEAMVSTPTSSSLVIEESTTTTLVMEKEEQAARSMVNSSDSPNHISAADYDASMDKDDLHHSESQNNLLKSKDHQEKVSDDGDDMLASDYTEKLEQQQQVKKAATTTTEIDMFADDLDMFADTDITAGQHALLTNASTAASNPSLIDNWDDPEGYYSKFLSLSLLLFIVFCAK